MFNNKTIHCGQQQFMRLAKVANNYNQSNPSSKNVKLWSTIYDGPQLEKTYYQSNIGAAQTELFKTTLTTLLFEPIDYKSSTQWKIL